MKFRDVRVSFNFEVEQFHDTRMGKTIDLFVKKKGNRGRYDKVIIMYFF